MADTSHTISYVILKEILGVCSIVSILQMKKLCPVGGCNILKFPQIEKWMSPGLGRSEA